LAGRLVAKFHQGGLQESCRIKQHFIKDQFHSLLSESFLVSETEGAINEGKAVFS